MIESYLLGIIDTTHTDARTIRATNREFLFRSHNHSWKQIQFLHNISSSNLECRPSLAVGEKWQMTKSNIAHDAHIMYTENYLRLISAHVRTEDPRDAIRFRIHRASICGTRNIVIIYHNLSIAYMNRPQHSSHNQTHSHAHIESDQNIHILFTFHTCYVLGQIYVNRKQLNYGYDLLIANTQQ